MDTTVLVGHSGPVSEELPAPRVVWIPQVTLERRRDDVDVYDVGAFTTEAEAKLALERWLSDYRQGGDGPTEVVINIVSVYDTAEEWAEDR